MDFINIPGMLSGFFDDLHDDVPISNLQTTTGKNLNFNEKKLNNYKFQPNHKYHSSKQNNQFKKFTKNNWKNKKRSLNAKPFKKPIKKKYSSPPRPYFQAQAQQTSKETEISDQNNDILIEEQVFDTEISSENSIMDKLLVYQKHILDNIANFRSESIKTIDLMINSIDQIDYSKYSYKHSKKNIIH